MQTLRLPDNKTITRTKKNEDLYVKTWRDLARPIENFTGLKLHSFDPDMAFYNSETEQLLTLPIWFLERINASLLKGEKYIEVSLREKRKKEKEKFAKVMAKQLGVEMIDLPEWHEKENWY